MAGMKLIGAAAFILVTASGIQASDFDFPSLRYNQRAPGSLPGSKMMSRENIDPVPTGLNLLCSELKNLARQAGQIVPLSLAQGKGPVGMRGEMSAARALDLSLECTVERHTRDDSLISRERSALAPSSERSKVSP